MNLSINNIWSPECSDWRCLSSEKWLPRSIVRHDLVHVADIDHILGLALVIGHAGVLEPVAPEDLIGKIAGADLNNTTRNYNYDKVEFIRGELGGSWGSETAK